MALEIIYRTKFRRLTNTAHYAIVNDVYNMSIANTQLCGKLNNGLERLRAAIEKEREYVLKKYDKTLTINLKNAIAIENKAFTAVYKMLKYKASISTVNDIQTAARKLVVTFDTYMRDRGKKTLGEWIGSEARMIEEWGGNEGQRLFERLNMTDMIGEIMNQHTNMISIYKEIKQKMVSFGYTKIAQYRQETDAAMAFLAANYLILANDYDVNISSAAKEAIDGINYMIEQFSEHIQPVSEDVEDEKKSISMTPKVSSVQSNGYSATVEDEEYSMKENERESNIINGGSVRSIKNIADKYSDAENPFENLDSTPMTEIDENLIE